MVFIQEKKKERKARKIREKGEKMLKKCDICGSENHHNGIIRRIGKNGLGMFKFCVQSDIRAAYDVCTVCRHKWKMTLRNPYHNYTYNKNPKIKAVIE